MPRYQLHFTVNGICEVDAIDPASASNTVANALLDLDQHARLIGLPYLHTFDAEGRFDDYDGMLSPDGSTVEPLMIPLNQVVPIAELEFTEDPYLP